MIRGCILLAGTAYLIITFVQMFQRVSIACMGTALAVALIAAAALYGTADKTRLKTWEIAALWLCILLFAAYALSAPGAIP